MKRIDRRLRTYNRYLERILLGNLRGRRFRGGLEDILEHWDELDVYERGRFLERMDRIRLQVRSRFGAEQIRQAILAGQNHGLRAPFHEGREIRRAFRLIRGSREDS